MLTQPDAISIRLTIRSFSFTTQQANITAKKLPEISNFVLIGRLEAEVLI